MSTREERAAVRAKVRAILEADRDAGGLRDVHEYKQGFPGNWDIVGEEYEAVAAPPPAGAPPTRVDPDAPPPSAPPPPPGEPAPAVESRLGPYRVLRELGRGGMGVVYLAEDTRIGRRVALKVLSPQFASSAHLRLRFRREAELAGKLDHPNICTVYEAGEDDGTPYLAMRFVEGRPLSDLVAASRELRGKGGVVRLDAGGGARGAGSADARAELEAALVLFEKACRALHAAHEKGLIHRDIKPHNIMVTDAGEPVLLDFGLAREESGEGHQLTQTGSLMGTPAYMSPEQLLAQRVRLDRRTDVYSMGVALYECLTLRLPFDAPTVDRLYQQILAAEPENPRRGNPALPDDLRVVLETALEKDRDRRYQSALELAEELRRVREWEPIRARPAGPWYRAARFVRRNAAAVTVATGVAAFAAFVAWALLAPHIGLNPDGLLRIAEELDAVGDAKGASLVYSRGIARLEQGAPASPGTAGKLHAGLAARRREDGRRALREGRFGEAVTLLAGAGSAAWKAREGGGPDLVEWDLRLAQLALRAEKGDYLPLLDAGLGPQREMEWIEAREELGRMLEVPGRTDLDTLARLLVVALVRRTDWDPGSWVAAHPGIPISLLPALVREVDALPLGRRPSGVARLGQFVEGTLLRRPAEVRAVLAAALRDNRLPESTKIAAAAWLARAADLPGPGTPEGILARVEELEALPRDEAWRRRVDEAIRGAVAGEPEAREWLASRTGLGSAGPPEGWEAWWSARRGQDPASVAGECLGFAPGPPSAAAAYRALLECPPEQRAAFHALLALVVPGEVAVPAWSASGVADPPVEYWNAWARALAELVPGEPFAVRVASFSLGDWMEAPERTWTERFVLRPGESATVDRAVPCTLPPSAGPPFRLLLAFPGSQLDARAGPPLFEGSPRIRIRATLHAGLLPGGPALRWEGTATSNDWGEQRRLETDWAARGDVLASRTCPVSRYRLERLHYEEVVFLAAVERPGPPGDGEAWWAAVVAESLARAEAELRALAATGDAASARSTEDAVRRIGRLVDPALLLEAPGARPSLAGIASLLAERGGAGSRSAAVARKVALARLVAGDAEALDGPALAREFRSHEVLDAGQDALHHHVGHRLALAGADSRIRAYGAAEVARGWFCGAGHAARLERALDEGTVEATPALRRVLAEHALVVSFNHVGLIVPPPAVVLASMVALAATLLALLALLAAPGGPDARLRPAVVVLAGAYVLAWIRIEGDGWSAPSFLTAMALGIVGSGVLATASAGRVRWVPVLGFGLAAAGAVLAPLQPRDELPMLLVVAGFLLPHIALPALLPAPRKAAPAPATPTRGWRGTFASTAARQVVALLFVPVACGAVAAVLPFTMGVWRAILSAAPLGAWYAWVLRSIWLAAEARRTGSLRPGR